MELIGGANKIVGSSRELLRIDQQLRQARDILVVSPAMSGLSTFLHQIEHYVINAEHFVGFQTIYLDCRILLATGEPFDMQFRRALVGQLQIATTLPEEQYELRLDEFLDQIVTHNQLRMVLILDNLQLVPEKEIQTFLEQIRAVSESRMEKQSLRHVLFVLGGQGLNLRKLDPKRTSPFNIADKITLGNLNETDGLDLANHLLFSSGRPYSSLTAKYIYYLTNGHPYFITQICSHLKDDVVPATASPKIDFSMVERVIEAICEHPGDRLFRQIRLALDNLSPPARTCLQKILNGARFDPDRDLPPLTELNLLGLISNSNRTVWRVRNLVYDRYLRQQDQLKPVAEMEWFVPRRLFVNIEGYKILFTLENDLRDFVFAKLYATYGNKWRTKVNDKTAEYCKGLKQVELERGWFPNENLPDLAYGRFSDLQKIINDNWQSIFHHYFKPQSIFVGVFDVLEGLRNRIAHNRPLTDREIEQLETYISQFRNCMYDNPL